MIRFLLSAVLLSAMISIPAFPAVSRSGDKTEVEPQYDPATVVHVTGTVIRIYEVPANQPLGGLHLLIGTDTAEIDTYLGPVDFLKEFEIAFTEGNAVEVVGSRVAFGSGHVVLAREARKGEVCLYLRDNSGHPNWPARRRPAT
jgi:hypothetical protein